MKKNQIVKLNHQKYKLLYRYGGEKVREDLPTLYYIMELEDRSKIWGYANDLSCFLKPTIKDIIDYVDSINKENPNRDTTRSLALIIPKQYLKTIKDSLRLRVYAIYNDLVELERWENYVAVVISKKITSILPVVDIVDAKDLAEDIPTIDFEDIDLGSEFENDSVESQKKNTIRFLFTGASAPYFADKEFEISKFNISTGHFDAKTCELELWSKEPIINALSHHLLSVRGIVQNCGIKYEVSEMHNISQNVEYDFVTKEHGFTVRIVFKNFKVISTQDQNDCLLKQLSHRVDYRYNFEDAKRLMDHYKNCCDYIDKIHELSSNADSLKYTYNAPKVKLDVTPYYDNKFENSYWYSQKWDYTYIPETVHITIPSTETTDKKEKENDIMKINNKELKQIIIDEDRKTVTAIMTDEQSLYDHYLGLEPIKYVTVAKASDEDDFDPYVGVAMTLAYQLFGSKENFRKFVRENGLVKNLKKEREAREAAKKEAQEKAEEARKKAATRKAKRAAKRAERDEKIAAEFLKKIAKFIDKTDKKTKTKKGE